MDTTFDRFDFTGYRQALEGEATLIEFDGPAPFDLLTLGATEREQTYQRAKAGANDIGDNRAAGSFFVEEMRARVTGTGATGESLGGAIRREHAVPRHVQLR